MEAPAGAGADSIAPAAERGLAAQAQIRGIWTMLPRSPSFGAPRLGCAASGERLGMAHRRVQIPFPDAPRGVCRWCGDAILLADGPYRGERDVRRHWHPPCLAAWEQSDPREARRRVQRRDGGRCAACGLDTEAERGRRRLRDFGKPRSPVWMVNLIVPLEDGGTFDLSNFQTLCTRCHEDKLRREAAERLEREREHQAEELMARAEVLLDASRRLVGHLRDATGEILEQRAGELGLPRDEPAQIREKSGE